MSIIANLATCLWFDGNAEEAAAFYTAIFRNSKILRTARYPEGSMGEPGSVMTVEFQLGDHVFTALNGGPQFTFTEAISLQVYCETQAEIDELWGKLLAGGGKETQCGWLRDRFGVSWQVIPTALPRLLADPDAAKATRVTQALLKMQKLIIADLERAARG